MTQDDIFSESEADRYWQRNAKAIAEWNPEDDWPLQILELYGLRPKRVIEIGAANGYRLGAMQAMFGCQCVAVEPSTKAISDGAARYPHVRFLCGTAARIPMVHARFDLAIVNFVLHWVDRTKLLKSVAEIDRCVEDGGYLLLGDFYPDNPQRVNYHHQPGLWTYKQDYTAAFTASGLYRVIGTVSTGHTDVELEADVQSGERVAFHLLRKQLNEYYTSGS